MPKITSKGIFQGNESIVEVEKSGNSILIKVNGEFIEQIQNRFDDLLDFSPALGGTYYPPKDSLLAAYSVLQSTFFDEGSPVEIKVKGYIGKIPTYDIKGIVY